MDYLLLLLLLLDLLLLLLLLTIRAFTITITIFTISLCRFPRYTRGFSLFGSRPGNRPKLAPGGSFWPFSGPGSGTGPNWPQGAHFELFWAQAREQAKTCPRRFILSLSITITITIWAQAPKVIVIVIVLLLLLLCLGSDGQTRRS